MIRVFFPGGTRTRIIQIVSLVYVTDRSRQAGVDAPWNVFVGALWSMLFAWAGYIGLSAWEARKTVQYFTSGQAGADAVRHALS